MPSEMTADNDYWPDVDAHGVSVNPSAQSYTLPRNAAPANTSQAFVTREVSLFGTSCSDDDETSSIWRSARQLDGMTEPSYTPETMGLQR